MKSKLLICFILFTQFVFSQVQNNIWCFGNHAGLDFNSGTPVPFTSAIYTQEGCASISDNAGSLLFYTDGVFVYNKNHIQMPNGSGLLGNPSSSESALIVPMPGSTTQYYVFSVDQLASYMHYSIVDMTLQGGLGDVTATKNVMLHPLVAEKQCAIQRCDGNIWIISCEYNTNNIYADLITPSGISPSVISAVGIVQTGGSGSGWNAVGCLKASQQGNRLALGIRDTHTFEVFDFDVNTGIVSNPISLSSNTYVTCYGVEFSPDGSKLYCGLITSDAIYQFNLLAGNQAAINASATLIGNTNGWACGIQLAPDGKIYVAQSVSYFVGVPYLAVINSPNSMGISCNFNSNGINLGSNASFGGLPNNMIRVTVNQNLTITGNTSICAGQSITLVATGGANYQWSGGAVSSSDSITVSPAVTTTYYLQSTNSVCFAYDTVIVNVNLSPTATVAGNLNICSGQSTTLTASGATSYQWSGGSTATTAAITVSPGTTTTYTLTPTNGGCAGTPVIDTVTVTPSPVASIVSSANSICSGQAVTLTGSGATTYQWSGGSTSNLAQIIDSPLVATSYTLQAINGSCTDTASVAIAVNSVPVGAISGNLNICSGQSTALTASGATSYQWSGGSTATTAAINVSPATTTTYTLTPSNGGCQGTSIIDTINVTPTPVASIVASGNSICPGQSVTLTGSGGTTYQWSGGSTAATAVISVTPAVTTTYSLQAINGTCTNSTSISIQANTLPVVLITGNQIICEGQSATLTASGATSYQWSGGSTSASASITVTPNVTTTYTVTGTNSCGTSSSTDIVSVNPSPVISILNPNVTIQNGASIQLEASGGVSYLWSNGSNLSCNTCFNPIVSPTVTTTYIVSGANSFGCLDTAKVTITLLPGDDELFIPNCITADGDGQNDIFYAYGINIKTLTMDIFDRWGELIFESKDKTKGWDAKYDGVKVPIGVYVYVVDCEWNDGSNTKRRGIVTVVR